MSDYCPNCESSAKRIAELEAELARRIATALDTNDALFKAEAENERLRAQHISADNLVRAVLRELGGKPCHDPVILAREVMEELDRWSKTRSRGGP